MRVCCGGGAAATGSGAADETEPSAVKAVRAGEAARAFAAPPAAGWRPELAPRTERCCRLELEDGKRAGLQVADAPSRSATERADGERALPPLSLIHI